MLSNIITGIIMFVIIIGVVYAVWVSTKSQETWVRVLLAIIGAFAAWLLFIIIKLGYTFYNAPKHMKTSVTSSATSSKH